MNSPNKEVHMARDIKLKPHQVLAAAIHSEIDAAGFYRKLRSRIKNEVLLRKLDFLIFEEVKHRKILEKLFSQRFRGKSTAVPKSALMPPIRDSAGPRPSVFDLFQAALTAEKEAEAFYNKAAKSVDDDLSRKLLAYLGRVERSHQSVLRSEIDLLRQFPDSYKVQDFHVGQDLFHIGP